MHGFPTDAPFRAGHVMALVIGGVPIGFGGIISLVFKDLTAWFASGAASLVVGLGHFLQSPPTGALPHGASGELAVIGKLGAELACLFLGIALIQAIVTQDLRLLLRVAFVRLPAALLLSGVAIEAVSLALRATDALSADLLASTGGAAQSLFGRIGEALTAMSLGGTGLGGFAAVLLAGVASLVALFLWVELVVRSAAVSVATLFLPVAFAGLVWPSTAHWARRLGETLAALILSKLVIAGVLALAAVSLGDGSGPAEVIEGIALLGLATMAPFSLLRLMPLVESGAMLHLDGLARRSLHATAQRSTGAVGGAFAIGEAALDRARTKPAHQPGNAPVDAIGYFQGSRLDTPAFHAIAATIDREIAERNRARTGSEAHETAGSGASLGVDPLGAPGEKRTDPHHE